jgi:hypothetical protein
MADRAVNRGTRVALFLRRLSLVLSVLWAVGSIAWVCFVIVAYNPIQKILNPMVAYQGIVAFEEWRARGLSDEQIAAYLSRHAVLDYGKITLLPPAILLVAMVVVLWAVRRVRQSPSR